MYIVKVRDSLRPFAPVYATIASSATKLYLGIWRTCVLRYPTAEEARQFVDKQRFLSGRESELVRDYRIFKKDGRKLTLIETIKGE